MTTSERIREALLEVRDLAASLVYMNVSEGEKMLNWAEERLLLALIEVVEARKCILQQQLAEEV